MDDMYEKFRKAIITSDARLAEDLIRFLVDSGQSSLPMSGVWSWPGEGHNPSWGQVSTDNTPVSATEVRVHDYDARGEQFTSLLALVTPGTLIYAQSTSVRGSWARYRATGTGVYDNAITTIPVEFVDSGPEPITGWTQIRVAFIFTAPAS